MEISGADTILQGAYTLVEKEVGAVAYASGGGRIDGGANLSVTKSGLPWRKWRRAVGNDGCRILHVMARLPVASICAS